MGWDWVVSYAIFVFVINDRETKYLRDFGNNLRKIRTSKGITQDALAIDAELGKNQIGLIECGKVNATISTVKRISKHLKVHPSELFQF